MRISAGLALLMRSRLISSGVWALSGKVIVAFASLAINGLLARLLTPDEMGVYFLVITWVAIAALIAQLGLGQAVVRLLGEALGRQDAGAARGAIVAVIKYGFIGALLMSAITYSLPGHWVAATIFRAPLMAALLASIALMVMLTSMQNLLAETLRGFNDIPRATLAGGMITSVAFAMFLLLQLAFQGHATLRMALWMNIAALLAGVLSGSFWIIRKVAPLPHAEAVGPRALFALTGPILLINILAFVLMQADLWILGMYRPQAEVGIYGAASRLAGTLTMISALLAAVLPPLIAQKFARNEISALQELLRSAATATSLAALPLVTVMVVFPTEILGLIYGPYYADGAQILAFLSLGLFMNVVLGMRGYVLLMTGHERTLLAVALASAMLNIGFCALAARYGGANQVALAAMLAMIINCILEVLVVRKKLGIWTFFSFAAIDTVQRYIVRHLHPR